MFKDSLSSLTILSGIALIFFTLTGSQHVSEQSNTMTLAQVVEEFNNSKHIKARSWNVPVEKMPVISEEKVLASLGRLCEDSDTNLGQRETLEAAVLTRRLPQCTHIRVAETGVADSQEGVQLELQFGRTVTNDWYLGDGRLSGFTVPVEL